MEPTPEKRRERIVAILARAVVRRVHLLRRSEASSDRASRREPIPPDAIIPQREILA
jgi:hypothetical protein